MTPSFWPQQPQGCCGHQLKWGRLQLKVKGGVVFPLNSVTIQSAILSFRLQNRDGPVSYLPPLLTGVSSRPLPHSGPLPPCLKHLDCWALLGSGIFLPNLLPSFLFQKPFYTDTRKLTGI